MTASEGRLVKDKTQNSKSALPIACSLSEPGLAERRVVLSRDVFGGVLETGELEDGYEFAFPGDAGWATRLVELIVAERACCPFFAFELHFEPGGGRILLRVRGPEGAKEFVEAELGGPEMGLAGADAEPRR